MATTRIEKFLLGLCATLLAGVLAASAFGAMRSERLDRNLCETTGGARYVDVPGFPGERIDRRLLSDISLLERRYKIFVTDGYSNDPAHAFNGEHPIGLALDIVPNQAAGGTWHDISALARWAEPSPDKPIAPFRWVGYNGDSGHGRGHHLHLSWNHSETKPGISPATVYTMRCPGTAPPAPVDPSGGVEEPTGGKGGGGGRGNGNGGAASGGVDPGPVGGSHGGLGAGRSASIPELPGGAPVVETGGVERR